jgi:hypothetical protein
MTSSSSRSIHVTLPRCFGVVIERLHSMYEEVRALPDVRGVESLVHERLKEIDRLSMEVCIQEKGREEIEKGIEEIRCVKCAEGWATTYRCESPRFATTVRGRVDYTRTVYRCTDRQCQATRSPFDEELGLEGKEHFTPLMQNKVAWAGASCSSFEGASKDFAHQMEMPVSSSQIKRVTQKAAQRALNVQDAEVRQRGAPASLDRPVPVQQRPDTVVIEMDGTCVMGRDGQGHEVKCATVFGLDARATTGSPGKERPILLNRCYCATSKKIVAFSAMVWALATWWGVRSAKQIVIVGDGIDWIWNLTRDRFHRLAADGTEVPVVEILDFYHAAENLGKARNAIYSDPESAPAKQWYDTWRVRLRNGEIEPLLAELDKKAKQAKTPGKRQELQRRVQYFRGHKERMRYPDFEAQGLPIGSGAIEGTCKNLIKGRMDGVGMRWDSNHGVEQMVALRVRKFNDRWEELWPNCQPIDRHAA